MKTPVLANPARAPAREAHLPLARVHADGAGTSDREGANRLFEGEEAVLYVIERIVAPLGLRVDWSSPWVVSDYGRVAGADLIS